MNFLCPFCDKPTKLTGRVCSNPDCRKSLDVRSVFRRLWVQLGSSFRRATAVCCPACNATGSIKVGKCLNCGCDFTVAAALAPLLRGPRRVWDRYVTNTTDGTKLVFQRGYFLVSLGVFAGTLVVMEDLQTGKWLVSSVLNVIFLTFLLLLFFWLIPRPLLMAAARCVSALVKLSLVLNYLTLLLLLQLAVSTWLWKAVILASQLVISVVSFHLLLAYVWPVWNAMAQSFRQAAEAYEFDPSNPQGRRAYTDDGRRRRS